MRQLQHCLLPFKQPLENIQPNLVTKDGELAQELERMKVLMARVGGKIESMRATTRLNGQEEVKDTKLDRKIEAILNQKPVELMLG